MNLIMESVLELTDNGNQIKAQNTKILTLIKVMQPLLSKVQNLPSLESFDIRPKQKVSEKKIINDMKQLIDNLEENQQIMNELQLNKQNLLQQRDKLSDPHYRFSLQEQKGSIDAELLNLKLDISILKQKREQLDSGKQLENVQKQQEDELIRLEAEYAEEEEKREEQLIEDKKIDKQIEEENEKMREVEMNAEEVEFQQPRTVYVPKDSEIKKELLLLNFL